MSNALRIRPADALEALWDVEPIAPEEQVCFFRPREKVKRRRRKRSIFKDEAAKVRSKEMRTEEMAHRIVGRLTMYGPLHLTALAHEVQSDYRSRKLHSAIDMLRVRKAVEWREQKILDQVKPCWCLALVAP